MTLPIEETSFLELIPFNPLNPIKAIGGVWVFFACWAYMKVWLDTELALFTVC